MGMLTAQKIEDRIEEYWGCGSPVFDCYVEELLGRELTEANNNRLKNNLARLQPLSKEGQTLTVHALVLTVGETFEPLLQAVCVHKPQHLVLVLNSAYTRLDGPAHGADFMKLVRKLPTAPDLPTDCRPTLPQPHTVLLKKDTPTEVFRELHKALAHPDLQPPDRSTNAVDITGAKKSMVVGAFMYAAYTGLPVTYVDFDKYSPDNGRPYGHRCIIGQIHDPYHVYDLRGWGEVRQLYDQGHFRAARQKLLAVYDAMSSSLNKDTTKPPEQQERLFAREQLLATEKLLAILAVYEAWNDGDHKTAKRLAKKVEFTPPEAVRVLGDEPRWPSIRLETRPTMTPEKEARHLCAIHDNLMRDFFKDPRLLLAYARDELYKLEHLPNTNEDNRSALLRAAALDELLLKARLVGLWHADKIELWLSPQDIEPAATHSCLTLHESLRQALLDRLMKHDSEGLMRAALRQQPEKGRTTRGFLPLRVKYTWGAQGYDETYGARPKSTAPKLKSYEDGTGLTGELLTHLRNRAIHTYLYVTQTVAQAAVKMARANLEDLEKKWLPGFSEGDVGSKPWDKVLSQCGIDFLPPIPAPKDPTRKEGK